MGPPLPTFPFSSAVFFNLVATFPDSSSSPSESERFRSSLRDSMDDVLSASLPTCAAFSELDAAFPGSFSTSGSASDLEPSCSLLLELSVLDVESVCFTCSASLLLVSALIGTFWSPLAVGAIHVGAVLCLEGQKNSSSSSPPGLNSALAPASFTLSFDFTSCADILNPSLLGRNG